MGLDAAIDELTDGGSCTVSPRGGAVVSAIFVWKSLGNGRKMIGIVFAASEHCVVFKVHIPKGSVFTLDELDGVHVSLLYQLQFTWYIYILLMGSQIKKVSPS